ncbi:hypothetical protein FOL47_006313 [Perkinsus chesapeaki]|uniref:Uncharacterized protein n=1 Tax=Perkinsus chesapeaki TaxID=330153 RepID=A0A7J6MXN4_PERCH|nr:hypothetical protein FOL47_006313 [Perkinsus chesapeaki]
MGLAIGSRVISLRRTLALSLFLLAYSALIPGLMFPIIDIRGQQHSFSPGSSNNGAIVPVNSNIFAGSAEPGSTATTSSPKSPLAETRIVRSTLDSVHDLFNAGYWLPAGLIIFFSFITPAVKLLILLYSETRGHLVHIRKHQYVDLRRVLRQVSKYQMVDVFVGVLTMAFLNHNVIEAHYRSGFYYFTVYCMASIAATQLLDSSSNSAFAPPSPVCDRHREQVEGSPSAAASTVDLVLLYMTVAMFVVGFVWALGWPILSVRFVFRQKIVVAENSLSLHDMSRSMMDAGHLLPTVLLVVLVVWLPLCHITMVALLKAGCLPPQVGRVCAQLAQWMWEWSQLDVFALALFITLFAFNAFGLLRALAPWGFYCVLMAAMSGFELAKHDLPPILRTADHELVEVTEVDEDIIEDHTATTTGAIKHRRDHSGSSFSEERLRSRMDSVASTVTIAKSRRLGDCCRGLVRVIQKLGLPFFVLKAIGWIVFFVIWWMNSGNASLNLAGVNETLKDNVPLVTNGLRDFLPDMVGQCPQHLPSTDVCRDVGPLYHDKSAMMEVLARWLSGLRSVSVDELSLVVPDEGELEMSITGSFAELSLSLYIGQCITPDNLFRTTNTTTSSRNGSTLVEPVCSALWDKVYSWQSVGWGLVVSASCNEEWPYVRNIAIKNVTLDQSLKISEQLVFGITINVEDLTTRFREGFQKALSPYIVSKAHWIKWGEDEYDMSELLNQLVSLNTNAGSGADMHDIFNLGHHNGTSKIQAVASVSSLTWGSNADRTTLESFNQQLNTASVEEGCMSKAELTSCSRNVEELSCIRQAMEWLKQGRQPALPADNRDVEHFNVFEFDSAGLREGSNEEGWMRANCSEFDSCISLFRQHKENLPLLGLLSKVLAKWCQVPVLRHKGTVERFMRNEDLCHAVAAAGVTAQIFSIFAHHDDPQVIGAISGIDTSELAVDGCLELLASASPELLLRIAWFELEKLRGQESYGTICIFCRCIVLLTALLKSDFQSDAEPDFWSSTEELVTNALDGGIALPGDPQLLHKAEHCREHMPSVYVKERACSASTGSGIPEGCTKCTGSDPTLCTCEPPPYTIEVGYGEKCGFSNVCGAGQGICYRPCDTYLHPTLCPNARCIWNTTEQACMAAPPSKYLPKWSAVAPFNPLNPKSELVRGETIVQLYGELEQVAAHSEADAVNGTNDEALPMPRIFPMTYRELEEASDGYRIQGVHILSRVADMSNLYLVLDQNTDGRLTQTEFSGKSLPTQLHRIQLQVAPETIVDEASVTVPGRRLQAIFGGFNLSVCRNLTDDIQPAVAEACASPDLQGEICHEDGGKEFCPLDQSCKPDGDCSECGWKTAVDHVEHKCVQPNPTNCKGDMGKNYCPLDSTCHPANSCGNCTGYTAIDRVQGLCIAAWWDDAPPTLPPGSDGDTEGPATWVCRYRRKVGMSCRTDMDCIYGQRRCVSGSCSPLAFIEDGSSTGTQDSVPLCTIDLDCGHVGFYCPDDPTNGEDPYWRKSCRRQKGVGEDCDADRECFPDLRCDTFESPPNAARWLPNPGMSVAGQFGVLGSVAAICGFLSRQANASASPGGAAETPSRMARPLFSTAQCRYCMPVAGDFANNQEKLRDWLYYKSKHCGSFWDEEECLEQGGVEAEKIYYALLCEAQQLSGGPYIPPAQCGLQGDDKYVDYCAKVAGMRSKATASLHSPFLILSIIALKLLDGA